ncbi:copper resistance CopC/CopD family protein [Streptomyces desertarenae]|uniref:Copper resistance CopC/CopD family protein n=1 Tax=Streptomyces desertarenae TaxID=2666184 RepID=A0ABW4PFI2_9ACTN
MATAAPHTAPRPVPSARPARYTRPLRAALTGLLLAAAGVLGLLGGAAPAAAHAALSGSSPEQGAVVGAAPREVTLTFTESVSLSRDSVRVLAPDGERVDTGNPSERPSGGTGFRYGVGLRGGLADGTYTVAWRAVSADSHPIAGGFTFSVGAPSKTSVSLSGQEPGGGPAGVLYDTARYVSYAGYLLLVGGAVFVLACWPGAARTVPVRRLVAGGWVALTAATIAALLLRGPYTGSGGLGDVLDPEVLRSVLQTRPGTALVARLLMLAAAALFVAVLFGLYARRYAGGAAGGGGGGGAEGDEGERRDLVIGLGAGGTVIALGTAASWALAEHASSGIQTAAAIPSHLAHLVAAAVWLGGLASLLSLLRWGPAVPAGAVRRFSRLALGAVAVLAATGLYQSWRQVGTWSALVSTPYGRLLLAKTALVVLMLLAARHSRRWTSRLAGPPDRAEDGRAGDAAEAPAGVPSGTAPDEDGAGASGPAPTPERAAQLARQRAALEAERRRRERDADPVRSGLRRSVLAEAAVAAAVLLVTTLLTATEPARTAEAAGRPGAAAGQPDAGPVSLEIPFDTGGPGGKGSARLDLDPGRSGDNTVHLRLTGPSGAPLDAPEVKVSFILEARDVGPLTVPLNKAVAGHWSSSPGFQLPLPGTWKVSVAVRTSDIDQVTERATFLLP